MRPLGVLAKSRALAIPQRLLKSARTLAGELAWPPNDAIAVVRWLASTNNIVTGVELWENVQGNPKWIATSDYKVNESEPMTLRAKSCLNNAANFIQRFRNHPGALFNLSWIHYSELPLQ
jgi:hypothetical protein